MIIFYVDGTGIADSKIETLITKMGFMPIIETGFDPWFPKLVSLSDALMKLMSGMLIYNVEERWTVVQSLDSQFLRGILLLSSNTMTQL